MVIISHGDALTGFHVCKARPFAAGFGWWAGAAALQQHTSTPRSQPISRRMWMKMGEHFQGGRWLEGALRTRSTQESFHATFRMHGGPEFGTRHQNTTIDLVLKRF